MTLNYTLSITFTLFLQPPYSNCTKAKNRRVDLCVYLEWIFVGTGDGFSSALDNFCTSNAAQFNEASSWFLLLTEKETFLSLFFFFFTDINIVFMHHKYNVTTSFHLWSKPTGGNTRHAKCMKCVASFSSKTVALCWPDSHCSAETQPKV